GEYFSNKGDYILLTPGNFYEKGGFKYTLGKEKYYIGNFPKEYISKKDDLVIAMTEQADGLLGSVALVPENDTFLHNQRIGLIDYNELKIDKYYLYYLFRIKSVRKQIKGSSSGTKVKHTSPDKIYDVVVNLPSIDIQKKIGNLLYFIEEKIEINNKINKELEDMAKSIYDYWFVQFDFPDENGKPYKSNGGEMVWSEELKREIPKCWEVKNLKENNLTKIIKAGIMEFDKEKIYLATLCVSDTKIKDLSNKIYYNTRESRANMQPQKNSVWFAKMKRSKKIIGIGDYSQFYINNLIFSTGFCGLEIKEEAFEYIYNFINRDCFEELKDRLSTGATQEAINNERLALIPLIIPEINILENFQKKTFNIHKKIYSNNIQNQELESLKEFLLPMLMNGQVRIK
ncbi:MAG: restriction endonuclease subunit S, partial [Cetobacterium sp.]